MYHRCQYFGDEAGLAHSLGLIRERIPIQGCLFLTDQGIQLVIPQERRTCSFMKKVEAEMKHEICLAESPCLHVPKPRPHGSCPYRNHVGCADERRVDQGPVRFNNGAMFRMDELQRIRKFLQEALVLFVLTIIKLVEDLRDDRQIFSVDQQVEVVHLAHRSIAVQLLSQHWATNWNAGKALLLACGQDTFELFRQEEVPCCLPHDLLFQEIP